MKRIATTILFGLTIGGRLVAGPVLYAGNGGHPAPDGSPLSINNGWLISIGDGGAVTPIGHPANVSRLTGLAFVDYTTLYASTIDKNSCIPNCPFPGPPPVPNTSTLIRINPDTGALISLVGPITAGAGGPKLAISDLAIQPGTGVLYGVEAVDASLSDSPAGNLFTIDRATGVATLVGNLGIHNASLAFAPDGTLYVSGVDIDSSDNFTNMQIIKVNPATGAIVSSVAAANFYTSLAFRASDQKLIGGDGDFGDIFVIDPVTGQELSRISNTGLNFVGDLDFRPAPEPLAMSLTGLGLLGILLVRRVLQ